jgi:hypothetical protein
MTRSRDAMTDGRDDLPRAAGNLSRRRGKSTAAGDVLRLLVHAARREDGNLSDGPGKSSEAGDKSPATGGKLPETGGKLPVCRRNAPPRFLCELFAAAPNDWCAET